MLRCDGVYWQRVASGGGGRRCSGGHNGFSQLVQLCLGVGVQASDCNGSNTALDLQERERLRIGFDLHDGPAQTMAGALLQVRMLEDADGDTLRAGLEELRTTLASALDEMYALIGDLGTASSIRWTCLSIRNT